MVKRVISLYAKQRILWLFSDGTKSSTAIRKAFKKEENLNVSRQTIWKFLCNYIKSACIGRKEGSGRPSKISEAVKRFIDQKILEDDETTATQLKKLLKDLGYSRKALGWTYRGKEYIYILDNCLPLCVSIDSSFEYL